MLGQEARQRIIQARERGVTVSELSKCYGVLEKFNDYLGNPLIYGRFQRIVG